MSVVSADSQETKREDGSAKNAIDGKNTTFWHTEWSAANPAYPHQVVLSLGGQYTVSGLRYLPRQDGTLNGTVGKYSIYVSADGSTWGSAVATGTFAADATRKDVSFTGKSGRYVKFVAESEVKGNPWASAAEINVLGK